MSTKGRILFAALLALGSCQVAPPPPPVYGPASFAPGVVLRVMFWPGKVAQHINPTTGAWETDPDGTSGGAMHGESYEGLAYCQKWYANAVGIRAYQEETISTWREIGNTNAHTKTRWSYECLFAYPMGQPPVVQEVLPVAPPVP